MLPSPSRQRTTQLYLILELIHLKLNGTRLPEIMQHTNNITQIFSPCHEEEKLILVMCKKILLEEYEEPRKILVLKDIDIK